MSNEFVIGTLNRDSYLTTQDQLLITSLLFQSNMTYFAPNRAEALTSFTTSETGMPQSDLAAVFNYHVIFGVVSRQLVLRN